MSAQDAAALDFLLHSPYPTDFLSLDAGPEHLTFGLHTMAALSKQLDERSDSLRSYGEAAQAYFSDYGDNTCFTATSDTFDHYLRAKEHFETTFPKWEIWFEHLLVNHMFFEQFPFQDRPESPWDEFVAISSLYALLRFLSLGCMSDKTSETDFIDMAAATFRLVGHTSFDHYVARIMQTLGCTTPQTIFDLISL
jgi:hypothetical protein